MTMKFRERKRKGREKMACAKNEYKVEIRSVELLENLSQTVVDDLASSLVGIMREFYDNPENERRFQEWQRTQREVEAKSVV